MGDCSTDLAVRAARAEIERDAAIERAKRAEEAFRIHFTNDTQKMLDTLHVIGIPARDLRDIYRLEAEWRKRGGNDQLLEDLREREALKARIAELEA